MPYRPVQQAAGNNELATAWFIFFNLLALAMILGVCALSWRQNASAYQHEMALQQSHPNVPPMSVNPAETSSR